MSIPDPGLVEADQTPYAAPAARLERAGEARSSWVLAALRHGAVALNVLQGGGVAWVCAWALVTNGVYSAISFALCGLAPAFNVVALWPWRRRAWVNLAAVLLNLACIGVIAALFMRSNALLVVAGAAALVTPQACALALQVQALFALWRGRS